MDGTNIRRILQPSVANQHRILPQIGRIFAAHAGSSNQCEFERSRDNRPEDIFYVSPCEKADV